MTLLSISQISAYLEKLSNWDFGDSGKSIIKNFKFKNFKEAIEFVNKVSEISEREEHHPNMKVYDYNNVEVELTTHSSNGLTEKDFKVASEIDKL
jgi:4a-hydroxytetrahydrobiopterin dehydratase